MRLINVQTLEFEEFMDPPPYAILSHRWTGHEMSYEAYIDPKRRRGTGYDKIRQFCRFVRHYGASQSEDHRERLDWAWVDTCCIDKRSSAELTEAINSMWNWYWNSTLCVAYLQDVLDTDAISSTAWLSRGWTLQEMLAPESLIVCNSRWEEIGRKDSSRTLRALSQGSGIPEYYLKDRSRVFEASVAQRMSWMSGRSTTRLEDEAYCLFGLFQINLPLLYGEGSAAFQRLQEEIIRQSDDESIFAWSRSSQRLDTGILAPSPSCFSSSHSIYAWVREPRPPAAILNRGLEIRASLKQVQENIFLLKLNCAEVRRNRVVYAVGNRKVHNATGCLIPLRKCRCGKFLRAHINTQQLNMAAVSAYEPYAMKVIEETLLYIHTTSKCHQNSSHQRSTDGMDLRFVEEDSLWDRKTGDGWYEALNAQLETLGVFDLNGNLIQGADGDSSTTNHWNSQPRDRTPKNALNPSMPAPIARVPVVKSTVRAREDIIVPRIAAHSSGILPVQEILEPGPRTFSEMFADDEMVHPSDKACATQ